MFPAISLRSIRDGLAAMPRWGRRDGLILVAAVAVSSCAGLQAPPLETVTKPAPGETYVYGRFVLRITFPEENAPLFQRYLGGAHVRLECKNGKSYLIALSDTQPLQIGKVTPSVCGLVEYLFTDGSGNTEIAFPSDFSLRTFNLVAGKANYLGDIEMRVSNRVVDGDVNSFTLATFSDNYESTTQKLMETFPSFSDSQTHHVWEGQPAPALPGLERKLHRRMLPLFLLVPIR